MRAVGAAERAFELMCRRANTRVTRGEPLAEKQMVQDWVASSRIEIDAARLAVLHAAWTIDSVGKKAARQQIAQIKVQVAGMISDVVDRAIQVHGALGLSDDTPLAMFARSARALRFGDGPDEVHKVSIARRELARFADG
jgi:acyl-CoA dehydrogenase